MSLATLDMRKQARHVNAHAEASRDGGAMGVPGKRHKKIPPTIEGHRYDQRQDRDRSIRQPMLLDCSGPKQYVRFRSYSNRAGTNSHNTAHPPSPAQPKLTSAPLHAGQGT